MKTKHNEILALIKREVVPAIGCTEPAAVALAVAKATELLGGLPDEIVVELSTGILKNGMGVGIPGTGMNGLPIAIAMGAVSGRSEYGLEVLKDINSENLLLGKKMIDEQRIHIRLKDPAPDELYIEARCKLLHKEAVVVIASEHNRIVRTELNGVILSQQPYSSKTNQEGEALELTFSEICDFAFDTPLEELMFIQEAARLNRRAAEASAKGEFGHSVGRVVQSSDWSGIHGNSLLAVVVGKTAAACDVRMAGAMIPVMSNSGSGNQGIAATLPVVVFAEENGKSLEEQVRALIVSHLVTIYIKRHLGRLSALCGAMVAAIGAGCGITWLMGGDRQQMANSVLNMIGNLTGMICDGAKPSCALKVSGAVSMAMLSAVMAMDHKVVNSSEGIVEADVDATIRNLANIGAHGMNDTNRMILDIMLDKQNKTTPEHS